jgi:1-acyl-sn-glycerol-3-phosphate acyltransferase
VKVVSVAGSPAAISRASRWFFRFGWYVTRCFFAPYSRLRIRGSENFPSSGGFVVAPGAHRSIVDTALVAVSSRRMLRFMGAESYFRIPVLGWFLRAAGGFPVERGATDREALRIAEAVLRSGEPLVVFPEATRYSGPTVQPLKDGAAFLAARAGVPLVPIGIGGAERAWPKGARFLKPTRMALVVGSPILPAKRGDGERVRRSEIQRLTTELRLTLQSLFEQAQIDCGIQQPSPRPVLAPESGGEEAGGDAA